MHETPGVEGGAGLPRRTQGLCIFASGFARWRAGPCEGVGVSVHLQAFPSPSSLGRVESRGQGRTKALASPPLPRADWNKGAGPGPDPGQVAYTHSGFGRQGLHAGLQEQGSVHSGSPARQQDRAQLQGSAGGTSRDLQGPWALPRTPDPRRQLVSSVFWIAVSRDSVRVSQAMQDLEQGQGQSRHHNRSV